MEGPTKAKRRLRGVKHQAPMPPEQPPDVPPDIRPIWCADPAYISRLPLIRPEHTHRLKYYYRVGLLNRSRDAKIRLRVVKNGRAFYTTLRWWVDFWSSVNEISPQKLCQDLGITIDFRALAMERMQDSEFNRPNRYGE